MKIRAVTKIITAGAIALGATAIIQQPSSAQTNQFVCDSSSGIPTILANGFPIMTFRYLGFGKYTPQMRCQHIANKFNVFAPTGKLKFLTSGIVNNYPVICFVSTYGTPCHPDTVLLTLKPDDNAAVVLQQLFNLGNASVDPADIVQQSESDNGESSIYINFDRLLSSVERTQRTQPPSDPPFVSSPTERPVPPPSPSGGRPGARW
jgi:hypothetical protein